MKQLVTIFAFLLCLNVAFAQQDTTDTMSWENIEVLDSPADQPGNWITVTYKSSMNLATQKSMQAEALQELKKKAAKQGYSKVWIDPDASRNSRFNKRGYKVKLVAKAY